MRNGYLLAPSILSANFANLSESLARIEREGGDWIHIDVMDGHFVPNLTIGAPVIKALRPLSKLPFDVHLMVDNPQVHIAPFIEAGADSITFHIEAAVHAHRLASEIRAAG
ncbi:MAG TPA: ribulose-phosphate 3-epimerase, partial [Treponemataceae bacterium]|nr:ribulose-phosphate 3-epimerase [Treponemataceae bacterium]